MKTRKHIHPFFSGCQISFWLVLAAVLFFSLELSQAQVPPYILRQTIAAPLDPQSGGQMGHSCAMDATRLVLGAPNDDTGAQDSGVVKIFNATTGVLELTIANPTPVIFDRFGHSVALSGNRLVVGAYGNDTGASGAGRVYVYDLAGGTPTVPVLTINNPAPQSFDSFGWSVALSGDRLIVGANEDDEGATDAGSAYVYDLGSGSPSVPTVTLSNPAPAASDQFGYAVAIDGTTAVVGAWFDDAGATNAGSAYVYDLDSATPATPLAILNNPLPGDSDFYGVSVAVSGSRVVVGAHNDSTNASASGSAYVYEAASKGMPPTLVLSINHPTAKSQAAFGSSLSLNGDQLVVGAFVESTGASAAGAAYVYHLTGGTPATPVRSIFNPVPAVQDRFGASVAQFGDKVLVCASFDDAAAPNSGSGYLYNLASLTPTLPVFSISHPGNAEANQFGQSVAVSGSWVAVGTSEDDVDGDNAGSVRVYDVSSATPEVPVFYIPPPSPATAMRYGASLALEGTRLVVGAYQNSTGASAAGAVYVYDLAGATPTVPVMTILNPSPAANDNFGFSLALSGARLAVGAFADDNGATDAGSVFVYDLVGGTPTVPVQTLNHSTAGDNFGRSVDISGSLLIVGAWLNDTGASNAGIAYVFDLSSATPTVPVVTMNNPSPDASDVFGGAVAIRGTRAVVGAYGDDPGASDAGSAYVYDLGSATPATPVLTLNNPGPASGDQFGRSLALSDQRLLVSAPSDNTGANDAGSAYVYNLAGATPATPVVTLANPTSGASDSFGSAVAIDGTRLAISAPFSDLTGRDQGAAFVFEPPSTNASLTALSASAGSLSPTFASETTDYTVILPFGTSSVTVTPTKAQVGAVIQVNGVTVASGSASGSIPIQVGNNLITVSITAEDGVTTRSYQINAQAPGSGVISFASPVFTVVSSSSPGMADIVIQRADSLAGAVSCTISSTDGSATSPAHFTAQSNVAVSFIHGVDSQHVMIPIAADAATTNARAFTVMLADLSAGASFGATATATVVILPPTSASDKVKPTLTLTAPTAATIVDTVPVVLSGTVTDDIGVAKVQLSRNKGPFQDVQVANPGATNTSFSLNLTPLPGANELAVRALDFKGNVSAIVVRKFIHLRTLTVAVSGPADSGSVNAGYVPTSTRETGKKYTITATPKPGFVFDGWTVNNMSGTGITTASAELPKLTFLMQPGLTLTANFITNPFTAALVGDFSGLVMPSATQPLGGTVATHATTGYLSAKLTGKGSLTGSLKIDGLSLPFTAQCDNTGVARFGPTRASSLILPRAGKPGLTLALKADLTGATKQITGTLAVWFRGAKEAESNITADRHAYDGKSASVPAVYVKSYTARLKARSSQGIGFTAKDYPQGDGFLTFTVKASGLVSMVGKLADDTPVTFSASLSQANRWPIFQQLYKNKGCIAAQGTLDDTQTNTDATAMNMLWFRPFQNVQWYPFGWDEGILMDMLACKYSTPPAAVLTGLADTNPTTGNTNLTFTQGLLANAVTKFVNLTPGNVLTLAPVTDKSFTFKPTFATGVISGTFTHSDGTKPVWQGVLLQKGTNKGGYGYFMSSKPKVTNYLGESGKVNWLAK